jgi:multidrug efflux pump subunit AcrA (membrane-fusion protein)
MKQRLWFGLILSVLLVSACSVGQTPAALPTVVLEDNASALSAVTPDANGNSNTSQSSGVIASGVLVSDHQIEMAFLTSGTVKTVDVSVGQNVKRNDSLASLDDAQLQLQLDQANLLLSELTSQKAISDAQKAVAEDLSALDQTKGIYYWWVEVASHTDLITKAKADLTIAEDKMKDAQKDYDKITGELYNDKDKAAAYQKLYAAQLKVKEAKAQLNLYESVDPYQMDIYKADVAVAEAKLAEDQTLLAALTGGKLPENPSGQGYAQLEKARTDVQIAQTALNNAQLLSPINGSVAAVNIAPGDFSPAGQVQIVLIDAAHLHIETTDLSERDIPQVKTGQNVQVTIKPLNQNVAGKVTAVSPQADTLGGDTVYKVFITLDELPDGALPGMSVTVTFLN